jgi:hypothetical protein
MCYSFSAGQPNWLVLGTSSGNVTVWDCLTGETVSTITMQPQLPIYSVTRTEVKAFPQIYLSRRAFSRQVVRSSDRSGRAKRSVCFLAKESGRTLPRERLPNGNEGPSSSHNRGSFPTQNTGNNGGGSLDMKLTLATPYYLHQLRSSVPLKADWRWTLNVVVAVEYSFWGGGV